MTSHDWTDVAIWFLSGIMLGMVVVAVLRGGPADDVRPGGPA